MRILKWLLGLVLIVVAGGVLWLALRPPELIRVGAGYAAKIVCSNLFLAGRDPQRVLQVDVQAPGNPILKLYDLHIDEGAQMVSAALLGWFGRNVAVARPGLGCAVAADRDVAAAKAFEAPLPAERPNPEALWPEGERVEPSQAPALAAVLDDAALAGPGMRAVVVVVNGRIAGERYGDGFSPDTPLLGWSMTKTVNAALLGTVVKAGRLSLDRKDLFPEWRSDGRRAISVADLMAMSSGLAFNEDYGDVTDVTRMLYLEPDMARFAASLPLEAPVGTKFSYSSGTAALLSRIWQDALGEEKASLAWPRQALFDPLGMQSAVLEADARGTFGGSSYLYATARDWARFGLFLLQEGVWNGRAILPEGFVAMMHEAAPASRGAYGKGQVWLAGPVDEAGERPPEAVPPDTWWLEGHDGQSVAVVPSKRMVVVRLGLTPSNLGYRPQKLVAALAKAVE